jgi:hypothetical protein
MNGSLWSGLTLPAHPGWRAARLERVNGSERRSLVPIAAWGIPGPKSDHMPIGDGGVRLDGPGLLAAIGPHVTDDELWEALAISERVAAEIDERMRRDGG